VPALFEGDEFVASGRIRLSALTPEAFEAMSGWLEGAVTPEWRLDDLRCAIETHESVVVCDADGAAIGMALFVTRQPAKNAATIPFLAIDPERRFRGLGGEAGLALERRLRDKLRVAKVYATVPEGRGLAVYFWLRLGLRPLSAAESPGPLLGLKDEALPGIWMLRDEE
jgi:GNAT superfamily N-acetyltransferase